MRYGWNKINISKEILGQMFIMDEENNHYLYTKGTGGFLWKAMEEPKTEEQLVALSMENYHVDEKICRIEIRNFLEKMIKLKAIVEVE